MATGDILSVAVGADGWWADITIEGKTTGGTYTFGLGPNNDPATGTPKIVFTVVSLGFDATGAATTVSRTVYGTKQLRKAYPNQAQNEESTSGGNVTVRVALSDYIYAKDKTGAGNSGTAPTVSILADFYTQSGGNNASGAGFAVTNNSTAAYPKAVANWTWPGFTRITGNSFTLRATGFHSSAAAGKPLACVVFSAADEHSHTTSTTVASMSIDSTIGDAVPVPEYVATMDASGLDALDAITCNFIAYPRIGDDAARLVTSAGTAQPTPVYGPIKLFNDKSATFGRTFAFVSATGNDGTASVKNRASYGSDALCEAAAKATPYLTVAAAVTAIASYNNANYSRNDVGGGEVIMGAGNFTLPGGTVTAGTDPEVALIIRKETGAARSATTFNNGSSNAKVCDYVIFQGLTFGTSGIEQSGINFMWFDDCAITASNSSYAFFYQTIDVFHITRSTIGVMAYGVRPFSSTGVACPGIVRGNQLAGLTKSILSYTAIGNARVTPFSTLTGPLFTNFLTATQTIPLPDNAIIAFNKITDVQTPFPAIQVLTEKSYTGVAVIQNLIEQTADYDLATNCLDCGTVGSATPCDNYLVWNNTSLGQGSTFAYNGTGSTSLVRRFWSLKNNIFDGFGCETDTSGTPNANRVGNWPVVFMVGASGNGFSRLAGIANKFPEYAGIRSDLAGSSNPDSYWEFTDDQATKSGAGAAAGEGTYTLGATSPARGLQFDWVLPYDLAGNLRGATDAAGAYTTYAAPAGGIGGASHRNGVDLSLVSAVNGIAKAGIASLNGQ